MRAASRQTSCEIYIFTFFFFFPKNNLSFNFWEDLHPTRPGGRRPNLIDLPGIVRQNDWQGTIRGDDVKLKYGRSGRQTAGINEYVCGTSALWTRK